jgi:hypothetical protein
VSIIPITEYVCTRDFVTLLALAGEKFEDEKFTWRKGNYCPICLMLLNHHIPKMGRRCAFYCPEERTLHLTAQPIKAFIALDHAQELFTARGRTVTCHVKTMPRWLKVRLVPDSDATYQAHLVRFQKSINEVIEAETNAPCLLRT